MVRGNVMYRRPDFNMPDRKRLCSTKQGPSSGKFTDNHGKKPQIGGPGPQPLKLDKPRPRICKLCIRPFARLEHLQRHERSHTKEKPFECQTCMRCFARKDLMLRHKRKLHVISRKPPRQGGDSTESTAVYPVSCDRICGRSIHHSVNSALPEKLTRDVALNADIVHHSDSSNLGLTEVADSYLSFCTVEGLENPARYSHIDGTSSAWSLVCSDGSQTLTATGRWKSFPGLYEDDEHTVYHSTISNSLAIPQAVGEVTSPNIGKLFDYGTEANTAKLYLDGNARARENASTLQSWTPEIMQPGFDKHNDCRWRTEWKSRQSYEHGSIAYGDAIVESQGCTRWCELLVNLGPRGSIRGQSFATTSSILKQDGMQPSQHSPGNDPAPVFTSRASALMCKRQGSL